MKTYTKEQYTKAQARAFKKGYREAKDEMTIHEAWENAEQVKEWNKIGQVDDKFVTTASVVVILVLVLGVFIYGQAESLNALLNR